MTNIFYFNQINRIGGTEVFLWEIVKKYKDYDITIFYDSIEPAQLFKLSQYVRCVKRKKGEIVKCKKAFYNFNISDFIDDVEADEHVFVSHGNYQVLGYYPPIKHSKITKFVGVSDFSSRQLDKIGEILGIETNCETCYNPLTLEPKEKLIRIVCAGRFDDELKGGKRMLQMVKYFDQYCEKHNRHYRMDVFSNPMKTEISSPNVAIMKPRVDVRPYIQDAHFVAQLSDDMETYCYIINEALGYGIPVITTPLSILKELDVNEKNNIVLNWNCDNLEEVTKKVFEKEWKPFKYKPPKDNWSMLLAKGKSDYKPENLIEVEIIKNYTDTLLNRDVIIGEKLRVTEDRANQLREGGAIV